MKRLEFYVKSTWRLLIVLPATSKGRTGVTAPNQYRKTVQQWRMTTPIKHLISKLRNEDIKLIFVGLTMSVKDNLDSRNNGYQLLT